MRLLVLLLCAGCGRLQFDERTGSDGPVDAAADAYAGPNRVFVTSTMATGDLGGLAGADAICQARADAVGLGGEFAALLWTTTITPSMRLADSRGWVDLTGRPIADQPTDFDAAATIYPIQYDETVTRVVGDAWTGHQSPACSDWTAATVSTFMPVAPTDATLYWFIPLGSECAGPAHLNCVEHGHVVPVAPTPTTGRIAFVSTTQFTPGGGLAAADAICNGDATAAGLAGTYRAWLGGSAGGPETRFTAGGEPWRRVDGVALAASPDALVSPDQSIVLDTFPSEYATGAAWNGQPIWTGGGGMHCSDWTTTAGMGYVGDPGSAQRWALEADLPYPCLFPEALLCLQL